MNGKKRAMTGILICFIFLSILVYTITKKTETTPASIVVESGMFSSEPGIDRDDSFPSESNIDSSAETEEISTTESDFLPTTDLDASSTLDVSSTLDPSVGKPSLRATVVSTTEIIVYTFAELRTYLAGSNSYTTFYIGANITGLANGIIIHPSKPSVIIDGCPPGSPSNTRYTYNEYSANTMAHTITVASTNTTTRAVTIKNLIVNGQNAYGTVSANSSKAGVMLNFENIQYNGPIMSYNPSGDTRFANCTLLMQSKFSSVEESAQTANMIYAGTVEITSSNLSTNYSVVRLDKGTNSQVRLEANANVTITSNEAVINAVSDRPSLILEENARLVVTMRYGLTRSTFNLERLAIGRNALLRVIQNGSHTGGAVRVYQELNMEENSTLDIQHAYSSGWALFFAGSNATALFDQPDRVFLSSPNTTANLIGSAGNLTIHMKTKALNQWMNASSNPADPTAMPDNLWSKAKNEILDIIAEYNSNSTLSITHNLTQEDPNPIMDKNTLFLRSAKRIRFGNLYANFEKATTSSRAIHIFAPVGSSVILSYPLSDSSIRNASISINENPYRFSLPEGEQLKGGEEIRLLTYDNQLKMVYHSIVDGTLKLSSLPQTLSFESRPVPQVPTLVHRKDANWAITISDTRINKSKWALYVRMKSELQAYKGDELKTLPNTLVFIDTEGTVIPMSDASFKVYEDYGKEEITLQWEKEKGILILSNDHVYADLDYTAELEWVLMDAP